MYLFNCFPYHLGHTVPEPRRSRGKCHTCASLTPSGHSWWIGGWATWCPFGMVWGRGLSWVDEQLYVRLGPSFFGGAFATVVANDILQPFFCGQRTATTSAGRVVNLICALCNLTIISSSGLAGFGGGNSRHGGVTNAHLIIYVDTSALRSSLISPWWSPQKKKSGASTILFRFVRCARVFFY